MKLKIGHLYPEHLNMYGDKGNIASLVKRAEWRGIEAEVTEVAMGDEISFSEFDIVLLGGGSDTEQLTVCRELLKFREGLSNYVESDGVLLALCGGYTILGRYYKTKDELFDGLSILDIVTEYGEKRLMGNIVLESSLTDSKIVGFENHSGRTYIGEGKPFGMVLSGFGNNGEDKTEGIIYKNVFGTYLHGPLLPKNPELSDLLIEKALKRKYGEEIKLSPLDDCAEQEANEYAVNRFLGKN